VRPSLPFALIAGLSGLAGCAHADPEVSGGGGYRPVPVAEADRLEGQVLVIVDPDSDRLLGPSPPPTAVDRGTLVGLAVAQVAREDAARLFGEHFRGGVQVRPIGPTAGGARVVVEPVARSEPGGGAGSAVTLAVTVSLLGGGGKPLWSRTYDSGLMQGQAYFPRGAAGERLGRAAHGAIERLLEKAVDELRGEIARAGPALR